MTKNPAIAFGLSATTAAMRAKCGELRLSDRLDLAAKALAFEDIDDGMRAAVLEFLDQPVTRAAEAGARLQDQILGWAAVMAPTVRAEMNLHNWQTRKDTGL